MSTDQPPAATALQLLARALVFPIPMVTLCLWFVLAQDGLGDLPATWALPVVAATAALGYAYCELTGFRAEPLGPGGEPDAIESQSWQRFNASTLIRFVFCEAAFFVAVAVAFVVDSFWPVLLGAVLSLALFGWEVWPSRRNRARFAAALEAGGHPSYLLSRPQDLLGRGQDQLGHPQDR